MNQPGPCTTLGLDVVEELTGYNCHKETNTLLSVHACECRTC
jgi:hypothetical protein